MAYNTTQPFCFPLTSDLPEMGEPQWQITPLDAGIGKAGYRLGRPFLFPYCRWEQPCRYKELAPRLLQGIIYGLKAQWQARNGYGEVLLTPDQVELFKVGLVDHEDLKTIFRKGLQATHSSIFVRHAK